MSSLKMLAEFEAMKQQMEALAALEQRIAAVENDQDELRARLDVLESKLERRKPGRPRKNAAETMTAPEVNDAFRAELAKAAAEKSSNA